MNSPTVYEYVDRGQVVERVQPTPEDYEDTRIGLLVLEHREAADRGELPDRHWRIAGEELANAEPSTSDPAGPPGAPDTAGPARPARKSTKE